MGVAPTLCAHNGGWFNGKLLYFMGLLDLFWGHFKPFGCQVVRAFWGWVAVGS